jgi:carboxylesterase type B
MSEKPPEFVRKSFPRTWYFPEYQLLAWHPVGVLDDALADKVSGAWINFARSGNPAHKGLPAWPAFNATNTATMHFDNKCEIKPQLDKDLFALLGK